ncbi:MAG: phosphoribosylpyrophosphate synthetase [Bacteroidetes bacterium]|nr:phosphoribosylpyrophosphate synthetase [Bacteroidota bacterium]
MARTYDTLSQAVNDLIARGYKDELTLSGECLVCNGRNTSLSPDDFVIDEFHRFEGDSNPSDESIVYAISSDRHRVKGVLINAFGPDAAQLNQAMVKKLTIQR